MATVIQSPETLSLLRNLRSFRINTSTTVSFRLEKDSATVIEETYDPNGSTMVEIDVQEVVAQYLDITLPADNVHQQNTGSATFNAYVDGSLVKTFKVIAGGVRKLSDTASNWLKANWLTWQPQTKRVRWNQPEYLSYYHEDAGIVKAKFYLVSGSTETVTIHSAAAGEYNSYNMELQHLFSLSSHNAEDLNGLVDVWVESSSGTRLSYIQRYVFAPVTRDEHYFLCVNSLGGVDTFCFTGRQALSPSITHEVAEKAGQKITITDDPARAWTQNTGSVGKTEAVWLWEFFASAKQWAILESNIEEIVLDSSSIQASDKANLNSSDFNFSLAEEGTLMKINRSNEDFPAIQVPSPSGELFFLIPRVVDFPDANLENSLLFLVQSPYVQEWKKISLGTIKEWLQQVIIHEGVHVWSGPWEQYSAAFADYALAASLGKDLLDRVVALERDLPADIVQSVAGVVPDEEGDVDADELKSALGLKSAAYRDEEYFARASHTHEISDITGLGDGLSTISSALQSLQAQIDSVASRDSFDELTASSAFIDMLAADDIYANRYHFTPDIFFSFELTDGVPAVRLNAALITAGDQVLGDGTPGGGGGGGGASYLHELLDVNISGPADGQILTYNGTQQKWVNAAAPEDSVQSVAGVGPDEDGDVDADELKSALGLKSAAYRDEEYFARASHTHEISDITGLGDGLSTISSAVQSLQAQIDSVASRDSFDELTASSAFIDMLAADDIYANRYHFTPDIFFSFELTDGVPAVRLNAALITAGDQVLGDGTPGGGGGGGGASYLYELLDVDDDLSAPVVGTLLQWYSGEWVGTTFSNIANGDLLTYAAGKWSNVHRTSVGVVTDATSSEHGLMSAADKSKLDSINTTHISHGETAYNALDVIGPALQSLQAQIDSVASRDSFDELTASSAFIDMLAADDIYGTVHGALDGNAATATNADKLDGFHAADLFSALGSGAAANLSLTVGGITRTATLYATYDSASENISDKFGIVGGALQGLQAQVDAVASRADISDFEASTEAKMDYMCDLMRSLQSQIDSVSTRINDGSDAYYDILSVGKAIYGDVLITTGEQTLSDERFKTITREIVLTAEEIASCRAVAFNWKHKPGSSFGSIAQDWQKILPEAVSDSGDELYLSYSQSAEVAVINLAREVVRLKKMLGINK